jgi:hypothetical protein
MKVQQMKEMDGISYALLQFKFGATYSGSIHPAGLVVFLVECLIVLSATTDRVWVYSNPLGINISLYEKKKIQTASAHERILQLE